MHNVEPELSGSRYAICAVTGILAEESKSVTSAIEVPLDTPAPRFVSAITRSTYALILAGGKGSRLHELTEWRAKPALFFGGKFRIIDFPLSNCINSGVRRVGVATQYKAHSLIKHVNRGWGHFKAELGESVEILPASQRYSSNWYLGTADAVFQNLDIVRHQAPEYVLILSGDHIYRQDYGDMLAQHVESGADMTISCMPVRVEEAAGAFGVISVDESGRALAFEEKPERPEPLPDNPDYCMASMGNYVFNLDFLEQQLRLDATDPASSHDFGGDVIPRLISEGHHVHAYRYSNLHHQTNPYWRDVGTLDSYWRASMELVEPTPPLNLYDRRWPIWTYQEQQPPAKFVFDDEGRRGIAIDSMVAGGAIVSGATVRRSILFSEVRINSFAEVEQSVILPEVDIGRRCRLRKAIIGYGCEVPPDMEIGFDPELDRSRGFRVTEGGVTLVTRTMLGQSPAME